MNALRAQAARVACKRRGSPCWEALESHDAWNDQAAYARFSLDFTQCQLLYITSLKVTSEACLGGPRKFVLTVPASMRLATLVAAGCDGGVLALCVPFADPQRAAASLINLFVPGKRLTRNLLLMREALHARGLMLCAPSS